MLAQVEDKKIIGIGSNIKPRRDHINSALTMISKFCKVLKVSPVYETPALLLKSSPDEWVSPFLNLVIEIEYLDPINNFLTHLQEIEILLGRSNNQRWSPRVIDLDILFWGQSVFNEPNLTVPHPRLHERSFVLDPLKDLLPSFTKQARALASHQPQIMAIFNLTPDSFSGDGMITSGNNTFKKIQSLGRLGVQAIDIGAESTRPGALAISQAEEISRLKPTFDYIKKIKKNSVVLPKFSLDTCRYQIAQWACKFGIDIINDVSGLEDKEMVSFLADSNVEYILTHSLGAPVSDENNIKGSVIETLSRWLETKLSALEKRNISLDRIYFDPGIGFGKTAVQSIEILKNIEFFYKYPVRILVGHSRKRFMTNFSSKSPSHRDFETLGVSFQLINKGVDVLRVHNAELHLNAIKGWSHVAS